MRRIFFILLLLVDRVQATPMPPWSIFHKSQSVVVTPPSSNFYPLPDPIGDVYYVSPTGSPSGTGAINSPWDLSTGLMKTSTLGPDDQLLLRGGTYQGVFIQTISGSSGHPIIIGRYKDEHPIVDGGHGQYLGPDGQDTQFDQILIKCVGDYVWYWGIEFKSSPTTRRTEIAGSYASDIRYPAGPVVGFENGDAIGVKFINCMSHDTAQGFALWQRSWDSGLYGCIIYYNGWDGPDRGHGHDVYTQNTNSVKNIEQNLIFSGFAEGLQSYSENDGRIEHYRINQNAIWNAGEQGHTGQQRNFSAASVFIAKDVSMLTNIFYYLVSGSSGQSWNYGGFDMSGQGSQDGNVQWNYFVNRIAIQTPYSPLTFANNDVYATVQAPSGYASTWPNNNYITSRPTSNKQYVFRNAYEQYRGHFIYLNWTLASSVTIPVNSFGIVAGMPVYVYFAMAPHTPVYSSPGWNGTNPSINLNSLAIEPSIGTNPNGHAPVNPAPEFSAFIIAPYPL